MSETPPQERAVFVGDVLSPWRREIDDMRAESHAPETRRAYDRCWRKFSGWANVNGLPVLPTNDFTIAVFLRYLSEIGLSLATVRQARAAIAWQHQRERLENPAGPDSADVLRGIARKIGRPQRQAAPLNYQGLLAIRATATLPRRGAGRGAPLEPAGSALRRGQVDIAIASVMRDCLMRVGEAAALRWSDVTPADNGDGSGAALIRRSKTDIEGRGALAYIGPAAMASLDIIRPGAGFDEDSVFGLKARQLRNRIAAMCRAAGLPGSFSGHSMRVGMAQDLAAFGLELPELMTAGRWKSSEMVARYTARQFLRRGGVARYYGG